VIQDGRSGVWEDVMAELGAAVIGPGWVAGEHVKGYCRDPRTEIKVIVGMIPEDRERAEKYMAEYGFKADYIESVEDLCGRDDVDVVSVCTRNYLHFENAMPCIRAGKHVLVEKPLCMNQEENKAFRAAALEAGVKTHVGYVARFYPAVVGLKNFLDSGGIGDVFYAECDYWHEMIGAWKVVPEYGGSALLQGGCHSVDMVRWMIGEEHEAVEVAAMSTPATWRKDFRYDPTIALIVTFDNGAIGRVSTSLECNMPYVFHLQVNGTKGTIRNNGMYSEMFPKHERFIEMQSQYPDDWNVAGHPFPDEISYFIDCIAEDKESMTSIPRAYKTGELVFAAEMAAREHRVVKLPLE